MHLDLAHSWAPADATHTAAHADTGAATLEAREDGGDNKGCKAEPKEGSDCLGLVASLRGVTSSVRDAVGVGVALAMMLALASKYAKKQGALTELPQLCV